MIRAILIVSLLVLSLPSILRAQPSISGGIEFLNRYEWRGFSITETPVVQPGVETSLGRFSIALWGSAAFTDRSATAEFDEVDLDVSYTAPLGRLGEFTGGASLYTYPHQRRFSLKNHTSPEFYVAVAPAMPLSPEVAVYYDANLGDGFYASLSIGPEAAILGQVFSLEGLAGYNINQFGVEAGFSHLDLSLSTSIDLKLVAVSPRVIFARTFIDVMSDRFLFGLSVRR